VSLTPGANLLPVSLTLVVNLPLLSTTLAVLLANLPPLSLIPVVHLDLQISPQIFEKIRNARNALIRGLGEDDSQKKPEAKILVTLSL
jgi:hypothetical protein